jgi:catechol 2,3-dioxygenase-like lactoylglutathione lyase family enzyme
MSSDLEKPEAGGASEHGGATHVLHVNLNTGDPQAALAYYVGKWGLQQGMHAHDPDGDWSFAGYAEPVDSEAWFLYDDRGPRVAPALELVAWHRPSVVGQPHSVVNRVGITTIGLGIPAGAAGPDAKAGVIDVDGVSRDVVTDADGVMVELVRHDEPATRLRHIRIGCSDMATSLRFYTALGFQQVAEPAPTRLRVGDDAITGSTLALSLVNRSILVELTTWDQHVEPDQSPLPFWHRGPVRFAMAVPGLDAATGALRRAGIDPGHQLSFTLPGTAIGRLSVNFLSDPDGLHVELVDRIVPPLTSRVASNSVSALSDN